MLNTDEKYYISYIIDNVIWATLVEAVFKLFKEQRHNRHLKNAVKFQWSVLIFLDIGFHAFFLTKFPLLLFNTSF